MKLFLLLTLLPTLALATDPTVTKLHGRATVAQDSYRFGSAVAVSDSYVLVGEPMNGSSGFGGANDTRGAAHLYESKTGRYLRTLRASDAENADQFGRSVALSGNLALVGANRDDSLKGAAYLFDLRTGTQLRKLTASDGVADDQFGISVALSGNLALVGAYGDDGSRGAAYAYDAATGTQLRKLTAADGTGGDRYGRAVALSGNLAVVGAYFDGDLGDGSGSAYFYRGLAGPLPLASVTKKGDFAPGTVEAAFSAFSSVAVNGEGEVALAASPSGKGAGKGGSASGLWTTTPGALDLAARGGSFQGNGQVLASVSKPIFNHGSDFLFHAVRKSLPAFDAAILRSVNGAAPVPLLEEGATDPSSGFALWNQFYEVTQPPTAAHCAVAFQYKTGTGGVNSFSDTGLCRVS
jgi:hypothetical protein